MKRPMESASGSTGGGNKKLHLPKPKPKTLVTVEKTERKVETSSSTTSVMEYDTVTRSDAVEEALEVIRNKIPATPSSTTPGGTAIHLQSRAAVVLLGLTLAGPQVRTGVSA